jgi:hypothetical protein
MSFASPSVDPTGPGPQCGVSGRARAQATCTSLPGLSVVPSRLACMNRAHGDSVAVTKAPQPCATLRGGMSQGASPYVSTPVVWRRFGSEAPCSCLPKLSQVPPPTRRRASSLERTSARLDAEVLVRQSRVESSSKDPLAWSLAQGIGPQRMIWVVLYCKNSVGGPCIFGDVS